MTKLDLDGIDGANPLGFLAAIGTLVTSERAFRDQTSRLAWESRHGAWRPTLFLGLSVDRPDFVETLDATLKESSSQPALKIGKDLSIPVEDFREAALHAQAAASPSDRLFADLIAAFGCESVQSLANGKPSGKIADTAFRTMSGSGHQHFLGSMQTFVADTTGEHLAKALFDPWRYDDPVEKHTMRWDPGDDIRYALRWRNPSGDSARKRGGSVWGANRLAIEALTLLPTMPRGSFLATTGIVEGRGARGVHWTWPIWRGQLDGDTIRSLLALQELRHPRPNRAALAAQGICEVYRSPRITQGKFRNFGVATPA